MVVEVKVVLVEVMVVEILAVLGELMVVAVVVAQIIEELVEQAKVVQ